MYPFRIFQVVHAHMYSCYDVHAAMSECKLINIVYIREKDILTGSCKWKAIPYRDIFWVTVYLSIRVVVIIL